MRTCCIWQPMKNIHNLFNTCLPNDCTAEKRYWAQCTLPIFCCFMNKKLIRKLSYFEQRQNLLLTSAKPIFITLWHFRYIKTDEFLFGRRILFSFVDFHHYIFGLLVSVCIYDNKTPIYHVVRRWQTGTSIKAQFVRAQTVAI